MAAKVTRALVSADNHSHGIPANQGADTTLHEQIARHTRFLGHRNGVAERRGNGVWQFGAITTGTLRQAFQNVFGTVDAFVLDQRFQRIKPFTGFNGIIILVHQTLPLDSKGASWATISSLSRCKLEMLR